MTIGLLVTSGSALAQGTMTYHALAYNLANSVVAACSNPLLRRATLELMDCDSLAITAVKVSIASLVVFPFAVIFEGVAAEVPFWVAIRSVDSDAWRIVAMNIGWTVIEQINLTVMCSVMTAVSIGVVDAAKFPVQWMLDYIIVGRRHETGTLFWIGTSLVIVAGVVYVFLQYGYWDSGGTSSDSNTECVALPLLRDRHCELQALAVEDEEAPLDHDYPAGYYGAVSAGRPRGSSAVPASGRGAETR